VSKNYQSKEIDTSRLAVPETVNVALGEIAKDMREGLRRACSCTAPGSAIVLLSWLTKLTS